MRICITRGVYGFRENGCVVEKTSSSAPFDVEDKEGKRLIMLKVAREARGTIAVEDDEGSIDDPPESSEDDLEMMSFSELRQLAKGVGVKGSGSREELIERLRQCRARNEDGEETLEESDMPELTVEEPE